MAITVQNSLSGPDGTQPTTGTIAASGTPATALSNPGSLLYDDTYPINGLTNINFRSHYARDDTGRISYALPSGAWAVRFYVRPLPLTSPFDINEYRHLFTLGTASTDEVTLVMRESSGRNVVTRYQLPDLSTPAVQGSESGNAVTFNQLMRYEIIYDGSGSITSRVFAGNTTTGFRQNTWAHTLTNTNRFTLSGYRWYKYTTLRLGDNDANTGGLVTPYQEKLLIWNPGILPNFGADGDYGGETRDATVAFQQAYDLLVDGEAGPEVQSALDLVVARESNPNFYPIPIRIGGLAVSDQGTYIGPATAVTGQGSAALEFSGGVDAAKSSAVLLNAPVVFDAQTAVLLDRSGSGTGAVVFEGQEEHSQGIGGSAEGSAVFGGQASGTKAVSAVAEGGVLFGAHARGEDTTGGVAVGEFTVSGAVAGTSTRNDAVSGAVAVAGSAAGVRSMDVSADGSVAFSGLLQWQRSSEDTGSGAFVVGTEVSGHKRSDDAASAGVVFNAAASGVQGTAHQVTATAVFDGGGEGVAARTGAGEGVVAFAGDGLGAKDASDSGSAAIVFGGSASGTSESILPGIVRTGLRYRLIAYAPNGSRLGQLPMPLSWNAGIPLNDLPSLALEYPKHVPGATYLANPCEVALELAPQDDPNYVEPPNCRFLAIREQDDPTDRLGIVRYSMPHYGWQLRKIRNMNTSQFDEEGKRSFAAATPGRILSTFIEEAKARGNVPGLTYDFTNTHDSAGQPWNITLTLSFDAGQDLWSIVDALCSQGVFDWRFDRRTFQVYNVDTTLHADRTSSVTLHAQRDLLDAPNDSSYEALAGRIFIMGDGTRVSVTNNTSLQPWGTWEEAMNQSGVSDSGTLIALAQARLSQTTGRRVQMTREIAFPTTLYLPLINYFPGDFITAPAKDGTNDDLRVRQITLTSDKSQGVTGNLVLNDRFIERDLRRQRTLDSLTTSTGQPGGGGGAPSEDTRLPAAPAGLVLNSETYIDNRGEAVGQISAGWLPVTTATDGTPMDIRRYEVWVRHAVATAPWQLVTVVDSPDTQAFLSPFNVEELYQVRVRAVGRNERRGPFTPTQTILVDPDQEPPPPPTTPVLSTRLGVIQAYWDGLAAGSLPMPLDFDHIQVWMSADPVEDFERIDTLYREGSAVVPNQPYNELRYFYFVAVDRSGNESEPSGVQSIATDQLVPTDVTPGSIGYELLEEGAVRDDILADDAVRNRHVAAGQITGDKVRAYSLTADRIAVGNTKNLITDPNMQDADLSALRESLSSAHSGGSWGSHSTPTGENGISLFYDADGTHRFFYVQSVEAASLNDLNAGIQIDQDLGRVIFRAQLISSGQPAGSTVQVTGYARFLDVNGNLLEQFATTATVQFTSSGTGELISSNGAAIPEGSFSVIVYFRVILSGMDGSGGLLSITKPFAATTNGQVLIEDGAISANKIQANAITTDKIDAGAIVAQHIQANAIQTTQLAADAITAKHTITGATIQTTATANRGVKMTSTGLRAYDQNGNETFSVSSATGNVVTTGTYRSGLSGQNRIVISDTATWASNPGLTMYSGASGARDSSLFMSIPGDGSGFGSYSVVLSGSEVTRNSSGRTDLVLNHGNGGGGYLRYQFGSYGNIGVQFETWNLFLRGRLTGGQGSHDFVIWGQSRTTGSGTTNWEFPYGSNAPNGDRLAIATGYGNGTLGRQVQVTVTVQNTGNFFASSTSDGTHRVQYVSFWVDRNI